MHRNVGTRITLNWSKSRTSPEHLHVPCLRASPIPRSLGSVLTPTGALPCCFLNTPLNALLTSLSPFPGTSKTAAGLLERELCAGAQPQHIGLLPATKPRDDSQLLAQSKHPAAHRGI